MNIAAVFSAKNCIPKKGGQGDFAIDSIFKLITLTFAIAVLKGGIFYEKSIENF